MEPSGLLRNARLMPETIDVTQFQKVRWGASGLDPEEVKAFLDSVRDELVLLTGERRQLEAEVERLNREREEVREFAPATMEEQAVYVLKRAQENAESLLADAQQRAGELAADGHRRRDELIADGRAKATGIMRDALDEAAREAARIASRAPIDAQARVAYLNSLGEGMYAQLTGTMRGMLDMLMAWERQNKIGHGLGREQPAGTGD
jgi:DivIVA domain-containing protein